MSVNRTHPIGGVDVLASDPLVCPSPGGKTGRILLPGGPFKQDSGRPKEVLVLFGVLFSLDSLLPTGGRSVVHLQADPAGCCHPGK